MAHEKDIQAKFKENTIKHRKVEKKRDKIWTNTKN